MDVINRKCKEANHADFKFYQAEVNITTEKVELKDLMIKIEVEEEN